MSDAAPGSSARAARALPANMADRLIVALDVETPARAQELVAQLDGVVSFFKIGLWLLFQPGVNRLIDGIIDAGKKVFLDYKMFDIGETVKRGVESAARRNISFVTVHGDPEIMRSAVEGRAGSELKIFAISVLTSLDDAALQEMGFHMPVGDLIRLRVSSALRCGCDGIIASPNDEPDRLRALVEGDRLLIATPGVRLRGGRVDDHKRFGYPDQAIEKGADYLVVGRPVTMAPSPLAEARLIIGEMEKGWSRRPAAGEEASTA